SHNWPVAIPSAAIKKPSTHAVPATTMDFRGPAFSTQVPPNAAESPSMAIATENIQPTETSTTSNRDISGILKTLKAYTCPIHKRMARAAAGMSHGLNALGATIASLSQTLAIASFHCAKALGEMRAINPHEFT